MKQRWRKYNWRISGSCFADWFVIIVPLGFWLFEALEWSVLGHQKRHSCSAVELGQRSWNAFGGALRRPQCHAYFEKWGGNWAMIPNTMAFSGIFPDFRTHIMYLYTYTTSGAKANGTTTPCAVASGQAARQSLCTTPSEGRQHRRVRLMLFHFVSTCFHMFPHVSTCFHMFPVLRHDFHLMSARFRQGWSVGVERERESWSRGTGTLDQQPQESSSSYKKRPLGTFHMEQVAVASRIWRKGFFPFVTFWERITKTIVEGGRQFRPTLTACRDKLCSLSLYIYIYTLF